MFVLLAISGCLAAAAQASVWPYHGSVYSLAAHPIVVPEPPARAVIGPSEGPVLVQGPQQAAATLVGPSAGAATIVGPSAAAATIVGPSASGPGSIVTGPSSAGATVVGGSGAIVGPSAAGASIVGPSDAGATIVGPSAGGATIIGPSAGKALVVGPRPSGLGVLEDGHAYADAYAEAHAEAHARADALAHNLLIQSPPPPPPQTVYVKEVIREPASTFVHQLHGPHEHRLVCAPTAGGVSTSAAVDAVARAGSAYGPVHVGSALGRPVVTLSGPPLLARPYHLGPALVPGPVGSYSSSSFSSSAAAAAASSSSSSDYVARKFWYPGPAWIKC